MNRGIVITALFAAVAFAISTTSSCVMTSNPPDNMAPYVHRLKTVNISTGKLNDKQVYLYMLTPEGWEVLDREYSVLFSDPKTRSSLLLVPFSIGTDAVVDVFRNVSAACQAVSKENPPFRAIVVPLIPGSQSCLVADYKTKEIIFVYGGAIQGSQYGVVTVIQWVYKKDDGDALIHKLQEKLESVCIFDEAPDSWPKRPVFFWDAK